MTKYDSKGFSIVCKSVVGGYQTVINDTLHVGPIFNKTADLWTWQGDNLQAIIDRLQANAPAMLVALQKACDTLETVFFDACSDNQNQDDIDYLDKELQNVRNVIAVALKDIETGVRW